MSVRRPKPGIREGVLALPSCLRAACGRLAASCSRTAGQYISGPHGRRCTTPQPYPPTLHRRRPDGPGRCDAPASGNHFRRQPHGRQHRGNPLGEHDPNASHSKCTFHTSIHPARSGGHHRACSGGPIARHARRPSGHQRAHAAACRRCSAAHHNGACREYESCPVGDLRTGRSSAAGQPRNVRCKWLE